MDGVNGPNASPDPGTLPSQLPKVWTKPIKEVSAQEAPVLVSDTLTR